MLSHFLSHRFLTLALMVTGMQQLEAQELLTSHPADDRYPRWSPDGEKIAFESMRDGNWNIYLMDKNGLNLKAVTLDTASDRGPSWHPTGRKLLFTSDRAGARQLYEYNLKSGGITLLEIGIDGNIVFPAYTPDGEGIAFSHQRNIFLFDAQHGAQQLTFDSTRSLYPTWSPDGQQLAFFSRRDTGGAIDDIYIYARMTRQTRRVTNWPTHNFAPSWSADGKTLVCATSVTGGRPELYTISVVGGELERLTTNNYGDTEPDWSPAGDAICYACQAKENYDICVLSIK